jgi:hypothetical protein
LNRLFEKSIARENELSAESGPLDVGQVPPKLLSHNVWGTTSSGKIMAIDAYLQIDGIKGGSGDSA